MSKIMDSLKKSAPDNLGHKFNCLKELSFGYYLRLCCISAVNINVIIFTAGGDSSIKI